MYLEDTSNCFYSTELRAYNNVIIMSNNNNNDNNSQQKIWNVRVKSCGVFRCYT